MGDSAVASGASATRVDRSRNATPATTGGWPDKEPRRPRSSTGVCSTRSPGRVVLAVSGAVARWRGADRRSSVTSPEDERQPPLGSCVSTMAARCGSEQSPPTESRLRGRADRTPTRRRPRPTRLGPRPSSPAFPAGSVGRHQRLVVPAIPSQLMMTLDRLHMGVHKKLGGVPRTGVTSATPAEIRASIRPSVGFKRIVEIHKTAASFLVKMAARHLRRRRSTV